MQQLGETREAMTRDLMKRLEKIINETKHESYYVLVHGKPFPNHPKMIKMRYLIMDKKPSMMLSCMLFHVNNKTGTLELCWVLPGSWPTWSMGGSNEPVAETVASYDRLEKKLRFHGGTQFFENEEESKFLVAT